MTREEVAAKLRARAKLFAFEDKRIGIYADTQVVTLLLTAATMIEEGNGKVSTPAHVQDSGPVQVRLLP
jgi:hypothetical protein